MKRFALYFEEHGALWLTSLRAGVLKNGACQNMCLKVTQGTSDCSHLATVCV